MRNCILQFVFRLLLCALSLPAMAQHVSEQVALERAQSFLQAPASSASPKGMRKAPRKAPRLKTVLTWDELYIFNDEANQGFVIVSAEECTPEILAYSEEGCINDSDIPEPLMKWLHGYAQQIQAIAAKTQIRKTNAFTSRKRISPLIQSEWHQFSPYNLQTPTSGGSHCLTGCVATAMAQLMNYWKHPQKTTEVIPNNISTNFKNI